jgi:hypothetical protein
VSLKANIFHGVPVSEIPNRVVREFREIIDLKPLTKDTYTIISYPGMRGESQSIVDSKTISKTLLKAAARNEPIVAVAHNFTSEALELLQKHRAVHFCKSNFFWSDESWANIRDKK